ncbi:MAG TPA: carboxymuconolactone decarboxylase family protein [Acidimicrobiales bacterium]|nr:carboxymuconolactone decarboxylase family protein [Acidimicrobiales bacterium]
MPLNMVTRRVVDRVFDRLSVPPTPTDSPSRDVFDQTNRQFVSGPPLTLHLPVPALFAAVWAATRESLLAGPTDRMLREVVAGSVSTLNECPYCVDSHTASTSALGADDAAKAVRSGTFDAIGRDDLRSAARWAAATRSPGHPLLDHPPFAPEDEPYAVGTALTFHYLNRLVSAFLKPSPFTMPEWIARRPFMTRVMGVFPGRILGVPNLQPGASLRFCPSSAPVPELAKLDKAPEVAAAWSALVAAAEAAGTAVLSGTCREVVAEAITGWDGSNAALGTGWIDETVGPLPEGERPAARFALLCALASYRIDNGVVDAVRPTHPTDADLVSVAAWASSRAALRIATWI